MSIETEQSYSNSNSNSNSNYNSKICYADNCKTKLKLIDMKCRCSNTYCLKHRLPELHNCSYNFKKDKVQLVQVVNDKVIKI